MECVRVNPGSNRCPNESPFHTEGSTTENARACLGEVRAKGTEGTPVPVSGGKRMNNNACASSSVRGSI